jgi:hypothetical protein
MGRRSLILCLGETEKWEQAETVLSKEAMKNSGGGRELAS